MNATLLKQGCINHQKGEELLVYQQQHSIYPLQWRNELRLFVCAPWPGLVSSHFWYQLELRGKLFLSKGVEPQTWFMCLVFYLHVFSRLSAVLVP